MTLMTTMIGFTGACRTRRQKEGIKRTKMPGFGRLGDVAWRVTRARYRPTMTPWGSGVFTERLGVILW